jgi:HAD superfamily hydrolase (TIGR01549 family)
VESPGTAFHEAKAIPLGVIRKSKIAQIKTSRDFFIILIFQSMVAYIFMNFNQYHYFIFDFDQTLVLLLIDWSSWQEGVAAIIKKYDSSFNEAKSLHSHSIAEFIDKYGKTFRDDYVNFGIDLEQKNYSGYKVISKTMTLLKTMNQQNKSLYLLTSNSAETVLPILEELKITGYFKKIITTNDVENIKPSPNPFKLIYTEDNNKNQYLMIGDSISDKEFAKNVDIDYLDVTDF